MSNQLLPYKILTLQDGVTIALLGTAHVSQKSVQDVCQSIENFKPDVVCVELDEKRYQGLVNPDWKNLNLLSEILKGNGGLLFANLVLLNHQQRLGEDLGVRPGSEMLKASEMAKELSIPLELCDRSIVTTLKRAWYKSGLLSNIKILIALIQCGFSREKLTEEELQKLRDHDAISEMMEKISQQAPVVKQVLIDERDIYLAKKIYTAKGLRKLAVVGAGHLEGIITNLEKLDQGLDFSLEELDTIPPKKLITKLRNFIFPSIIIFTIVLLVSRSGEPIHFGKLLVMSWFFWNVLFGALGALAALAHPLAILASAVLSPITSLIPGVGSGPIVAAIQFFLHHPKIEDFENLRKLNTVRDWYKNRIGRILVTGILSSIGSGIGAIVALSHSFSK